MDLQIQIDIASSPEEIWAVMSDVGSWPEWTASMTQVGPLEPGTLRVGSTVRTRQPKLPATVWRVTHWEPNRGFAWEARSLGAHTIAEHWIAQKAQNLCTVTLAVKQTGVLANLLAPFLVEISREFVNMEAQGLKRRCETRSAKSGQVISRREA